MALTTAKATPTVLVPELLSFSPHFLLDDIINIANDGVGRAVDAMEDFLNRWAETRLEREPDWDADKELEQGLVSFQTLLEYHTDIAFDFFEAWSLRNIFALPPDLPLVAPHHKELDLNQPPGREAELLAEIDELWRAIEKVRLCSCNTKPSFTRLTNKNSSAAKTIEIGPNEGSAGVQTPRKTVTSAPRPARSSATRQAPRATHTRRGRGYAPRERLRTARARARERTHTPAPWPGKTGVGDWQGWISQLGKCAACTAWEEGRWIHARERFG